MADYEELINELDTKDMRSTLKSMYEQVKKGIEAAKDLGVIEEINKIIVFGMGGSALPGYILKQYLHNFHIPIFVIEDYDVPDYVDTNSLVFIISYSGNTEEVISAYRQTVKIHAKVISITSGGKLKDLCEFNKTTLVTVPSGIAPRLAYGYMFFPILRILENSKIIPDEASNLKMLLSSLKNTDFEDMGKKLANRIIDKTPVIYASNKLAAVAWKWKINFNETSKIPAYYNIFPALNHNELNEYDYEIGDYYIIILRDSSEHPRVSRRIDITKKIIKEKDIPVTEIGIKGDCYLTRLFSSMLIGDWAAYYLAIINERDPSNVKTIDDFKDKLKQM